MCYIYMHMILMAVIPSPVYTYLKTIGPLPAGGAVQVRAVVIFSVLSVCVAAVGQIL